MTDRLWYADPALLRFRGTVTALEDEGRRVVLDRTAFYPTSGGQPHDTGTLGGVRVTDVLDEEVRVVHVLAAPLAAAVGDAVEGTVDAERRHDHSRQHTAQHLLSAILEDRFRRPTVGFHLGAETATIDVAGLPIGAPQFAEVEAAVNAAIQDDLPVSWAVHEDVSGLHLRKPTDRAGAIRVVTIADLDINACGGTHVASTGRLGVLLLLGAEKVRDATRLTFVAGARAVRQARGDRDRLAAAAQALGCALDDVPTLVTKQKAALLEAEKALRALRKAAAEREARERHAAAAPDAHGRRVLHMTVDGELDDATRTLAQGFAALPGGVALVSAAATRTVLLAAAPDAGVDCGTVLKAVLAEVGGRGGGQAGSAQGTVPDAAALASVRDRLAGALRLPT
jgi:alanyl-tRNA synthetase